MQEESFESIRKSAIINTNGISYTEYRADLKPIYKTVWLHISLAYIAIFAVLIGSIMMQLYFSNLFWLNIILSAVILGYTIAYLQLFIHEAAHFNIASNREKNDFLANAFIGLMVGMDIKFYRKIHFEHHRYLGTVLDTEKTYFNALNWRFIIESLTGIQVIKVLRNRNDKSNDSKTTSSNEEIKKNKKMLILGMLFNLIIVGTLFLVGLWQTAIAWVIALGVIFPFFGALRQLLEHRSEKASHLIDYNKEDQGITNRIFSNGLISNTFGGAGFNRHLLHHWDPQISYTRLRDVENFLLDTQCSSLIKSHKTNYFKTFFTLFNH